jgi:hypothetical protein
MIALVVVGILAKKQLGASPIAPASLLRPGQVDPALTPPDTRPGVSSQAQSREQQQQQLRQSLESAMQQARPMPDDQ